MLEINPVLAGTFDQANYTPAATNIGSNATEDVNGVDARRYTQFDRSAADVGTSDFSFGDLLDMLNPLEHIPLISSAYRAITGDNIHPVARVAGDILYGGLAGGVSALAGGAGAIADEVIRAKTGEPAMAYAANSLFGSGDAVQTEVADAAATALPPPVAAASAPAPVTPTVAPTAVIAAAPAAPSITPLASVDTSASPLTAAKAYPLTPNRLPYGGVMDTSNIARQQDMAIALSEASPTGLRLGHTIYTNGLMAGLHQAPDTHFSPNLAMAPAATSNGGTNGNSNPQQNSGQLPQALLDDISALKALNSYKSTASRTSTSGSNVDITN
jgi:hypothetical protein